MMSYKFDTIEAIPYRYQKCPHPKRWLYAYMGWKGMTMIGIFGLGASRPPPCPHQYFNPLDADAPTTLRPLIKFMFVSFVESNFFNDNKINDWHVNGYFLNYNNNFNNTISSPPFIMIMRVVKLLLYLVIAVYHLIIRYHFSSKLVFKLILHTCHDYKLTWKNKISKKDPTIR